MITKTGIERAQILDGTTQANRLAVNSTGEIVVRDHFLEIGAGHIADHHSYGFFGRNPDIDTASGFETVWNGGGIYTGQNATAAEQVELYSSDAADTAAGTGLRTLWLSGLDANYNQVTEVVTLLGATSVYTTASFLRLTYAEGVTAGSGGKNAGTIVARQRTTVANVFFNMPIGMNHTAVAAFTVPADEVCLIAGWGIHVISKAAASCEGRLFAREPSRVWMCEDVGTAANTHVWYRRYPYFSHHIFGVGTDIRIDADTSANNTVIGACMDIILLPATGD